METTNILKELLKNSTPEFGVQKAGHHEFHDLDREEVEWIGLDAETDRYKLDDCVKWIGQPTQGYVYDKEMEESIFLNFGQMKMIDGHIQELWDAKNKELENEYENAVYDCDTYEPNPGWQPGQ